MGLGRPPTFLLTYDQWKNRPFQHNTKVRIGCLHGEIIDVGIEVERGGTIRGMFCNVHFSEVDVKRWINWDDLSLV